MGASTRRSGRGIIADTRGADESECELDATLFGDLGLESIDFLEISFRMEESFGFPYPTNDTCKLFNTIVADDTTTEEVRSVIETLRGLLCMDVPSNLPGVEPFDREALRDAVLGLFTVGHLVTFVERELAT